MQVVHDGRVVHSHIVIGADGVVLAAAGPLDAADHGTTIRLTFPVALHRTQVI